MWMIMNMAQITHSVKYTYIKIFENQKKYLFKHIQNFLISFARMYLPFVLNTFAYLECLLKKYLLCSC